jgi:hypothetical protein
MRLFVMNGAPLKYKSKIAAFRRLRSGDDIRSNIHAGGKKAQADVDDRALRIVEIVRPKLVADGMFLVGLDIVGDKLMEINVFSPGGLGSAQSFEGVNFAVWAPNAKSVSVLGNFNHWHDKQHRMNPRWDESGIWEGFFPDIKHGEAYKYALNSISGEYQEKSDPFASFCELPPKTASIVWTPKYEWKDSAWLQERKNLAGKKQPYSVYEVHYGSWMRKDDGKNSLTYPEMALQLVVVETDKSADVSLWMPVLERLSVAAQKQHAVPVDQRRG